jgi:hypothetical protein
MSMSDAEKLLSALERHREGLSRTQINRDVFKGRMTAKELASLLDELRGQCLIHRVIDKRGLGRPIEWWRAGWNGTTEMLDCHGESVNYAAIIPKAAANISEHKSHPEGFSSHASEQSANTRDSMKIGVKPT